MADIIRTASLPYRKDYPVYRGDTVVIQFTVNEGTAQNYTPVNLAGWVFTCKVRDNEGTVIESYTEGSGITVTDADGLVSVKLPATDTAALIPGCCYKYDVQGVRTSDSYTKTYLAGELQVSKDTTY